MGCSTPFPPDSWGQGGIPFSSMIPSIPNISEQDHSPPDFSFATFLLPHPSISSLLSKSFLHPQIFSQYFGGIKDHHLVYISTILMSHKPGYFVCSLWNTPIAATQSSLVPPSFFRSYFLASNKPWLI